MVVIELQQCKPKQCKCHNTATSRCFTLHYTYAASAILSKLYLCIS